MKYKILYNFLLNMPLGSYWFERSFKLFLKVTFRQFKAMTSKFNSFGWREGSVVNAPAV